MPTSRFQASLVTNKNKKYEVFSGRNKFFPLGIGGDQIIESNYFRYHIFTTTGSVSFVPDSNLRSLDICAIGGGGGGGSDTGGGGGAGDITKFQTINISNQTYTVVVGNKGLGSTTVDVKGSNGQSSIFKTSSEELLVALGGGGGGSGFSEPSAAGNSGGSGGGSTSSPLMVTVSGASASGFNANNGGDSTRDISVGVFRLIASGGGGGSFFVGQSASVNSSGVSFSKGGNGGQGINVLDIDDGLNFFTTIYGMTTLGSGGGGVGSVQVNNTPNQSVAVSGIGGTGGGNGANDSPLADVAATAATSFGSGGGGGGWSARSVKNGTDGYQGIVIVRYPIKIYEYVL